jgi:hypothetical protein
MLEPVFSRRLFYIFVLVFLGLSLTLKSFAQVVDRALSLGLSATQAAPLLPVLV